MDRTVQAIMLNIQDIADKAEAKISSLKANTGAPSVATGTGPGEAAT